MKSSNKKKSAARSDRRKAAMPRQSVAVKPNDITLREWQIALRRQIAQKGNFVVEPDPEKGMQGYYTVMKPIYAKVTMRRLGETPGLIGYGTPYKVVYRGDRSKWNYCACMDFKASGLGTCKHIEAVKHWIDSGNRRVARVMPSESSVYIDYADSRRIKIRIGSTDKFAIAGLAHEYFDENGVFKYDDVAKLYEFMDRVNQVSRACRCYPDVYERVGEILRRNELQALAAKVDDKLIQSLMRVPLFRYQIDGVKFAFGHGRSIIADEMGLGKTIQAIATAELLRHFRLATSVLVVCPTSLKYQWKHEIEKFSGSSVVVVEGNARKRKDIYETDDSYYKIISYNALANDIKYQGRMVTDLLVMDEVQRLKNWDTQIAKAARKIESTYTVLLSGTPLENKLEELYSIVELVDQYALSPYYLFRHDYVVTDEAGMTVGYKNLNHINRRLANLLIRRRKRDVAMQMPARMDKTLYVPMTKQQKMLHDELAYKVSILVHKWRAYHFLSEQDRLRLLMLLGQMRMVANSTFILDQVSRHDTKIEEVRNILLDIFATGDEKVVIFSGWERMTRLIAVELDAMGVRYSNLNGSVPSAKRKRLVEDFTNDPDCRVFLSTDAGATGLNLQAGSIVINMELPWNPAVHEQRIGRIYRLGQTRNIQVINMVSVDSIEQDIETKLQFKSAVAEGILDNGDDSVFLPKKQFDEIIETLDKLIDEKETSRQDSVTDPLTDPLTADADGMPDEDTEQPLEHVGVTDHDALVADDDTEDVVGNVPVEPAENIGEDNPAPHKTPAAAAVSQPAELVRQGMSFLAGLAETLKSPERTQALVDEIVKTDADGNTSIRIPVADKKTVTNVLSVIGALFKQ